MIPKYTALANAYHAFMKSESSGQLTHNGQTDDLDIPLISDRQRDV
jgi:hypothetical protein